MANIYPLIICGGTGTRLWPLSRSHSPKQFQRIGGAETLTFFQTAVQRHRGVLYREPCIVTGQKHRATAMEQLDEIQVTGRMICEPQGRNTGPAVLAAAHELMASDPGAILVVIPADHVITGDLTGAILRSIPAVEDGRIVTFGVMPRYAETGFGYIADGGPLEGLEARRVGGFIEKPPVEEAEKLIEGGEAYWASGLSMFSAQTLIDEYARFDADTVAAVGRAVAEGERRDGTLFLAEAHFAKAASKPTEQVVFEQTDRMALMTLDVEWDDVGSWRAMYDIAQHDSNGNVLQGDVIAHSAKNTLVRADSRLVSVVGLSDVVIVDTPDALLIARKDGTQNVKQIVEELKARGRSEAEAHPNTEPAMVPMMPSAKLDKLAPTDQFKLGTSKIAVGRSVQFDRGPITRQVIVVQGTVHAIGPTWSKTVREGGRIYGDETGAVRLINQGDGPAELLHLTLMPNRDLARVQPRAKNV